MEWCVFVAGIDDNGRRLDRVLSRLLKNVPVHSPFPLLRKKLIRVNGHKAEGKTTVRNGDEIQIAAFLFNNAGPHSTSIKPKLDSQPPFLTLFRNQHLWVIEKPRGMAVQPLSTPERSVCDWVAQSVAQESLSFVPAPLHRLDRHTSGLLVISQSLAGARWFSKALSAGTVQKWYVGLASGTLTATEHWESKIAGNSKIGKFYTVSVSENNVLENQKQNSPAKTTATPLAQGSYRGIPVTLVQFQIHTGKKHQIRAQAAENAHPLLGDTAYGAPPLDSGAAFFLHALKLRVPENNPVGLPPVLEAPLPADFKKMLDSSLIHWNGQVII